MLTAWLIAIIRQAIHLSWIFGLLLAAELVFPKEKQSVISRLRAGTFWALYVPLAAVVTVAFATLWRWAGIQPLAALDLRHFPLAGVVGPLLGAILGDFAFYWMHRAQHRFFWRFHAVHHSIEEMNAVASYHHVSEEVVRTLFITIPAALFVTETEAVPVVFVLVAMQGFYLHSCTRLHLGPLRWLIGDNRFHRIHHSTDPAHFNKNFSGFSPIWDVLFGTAYFPARDEWPKTGLLDRPEPQTISDYVMRPLRDPT